MKPRPNLLVCDACDALYARPALADDAMARCVRCGTALGRGHRVTLDEQLALAIAALVLLVIANLSPLVTLNLRGLRTEATLLDCVRLTWQAGEPLVALLAVGTAFVFPLALIVLRLYVLAPLTAGVPPRGFVRAMRMLRWVTQWSMVEVFMLGVLISVVRSAGLAQAGMQPGLFAYAGVMLLLTASIASGQRRLWQRFGEVQAAARAGAGPAAAAPRVTR
jgi:paraquat-inducible protein A